MTTKLVNYSDAERIAVLHTLLEQPLRSTVKFVAIVYFLARTPEETDPAHVALVTGLHVTVVLEALDRIGEYLEIGQFPRDPLEEL